jgi:pimeloyl-ACP methyl ester carboxylesterase
MNLPAQVAVHFLQAGHMPHWGAPAEVAALILQDT